MLPEETVLIRIKALLRSYQKGLTIEQISKKLPLNRNSTAKYLNTLVMSGQAEMQVYGRAKVFINSARVPSSQLFSYASDMILLLDQDKKIRLANKPLRTFFNLIDSNLVNSDIMDTPLTLLFTGNCIRSMDEAMAGKVQTIDHEFVTNGRHFTLRLNFIPVVLPGGERGLAVFIEDSADGKYTEHDLELLVEERSRELRAENQHLQREIDAYEKASATLRTSEDRFGSLIENGVDIFYRADLNGNLLHTNPAMLSLLGLSSPEQVIGRPITDFWEDPRHRGHMLTAMQETGFIRDFETTLVTTGKKPVPVSVSSNFFYDSSGNRAGIEGIIRDISERKFFERALQSSEEKYRSIIDSFPDLYYETDMENSITFISSSCLRLSGYTRNELIGRNITEFYADSEQWNEIRQKLLLNGWVRDYEITLMDKFGHFFPVSVNSQVIYDTLGNPARIAGSVRDISERKRTEGALQQSEELFRSLVAESFDGILITNEKGAIIEWNHALAEITGIPRASAVGKDIINLIARVYPTAQPVPGKADKIRTCIQSALTTGMVPDFSSLIETEICRPDSMRRIIQLALFPIRTATGFRIGAIIRDITHTRQAERVLLECKNRFAINEAIGDTFYRCDRAGNITMASAGLTTLLGYDSPPECAGKTHTYGFFCNPTERQQFKKNISLCMPCMTPEIAMVRTDGIPVIISHDYSPHANDAENDLSSGGMISVSSNTDRPYMCLRCKCSKIPVSKRDCLLSRNKTVHHDTRVPDVYDQAGQTPLDDDPGTESTVYASGKLCNIRKQPDGRASERDGC